MIALKILEIKDFGKLILLNKESKKTYELIFQFYDVKIHADDTLILNEKLLDSNFEGFVQPYCFEKCDKKIEEISDNCEFAVLHKKTGENFVLKHVYG